LVTPEELALYRDREQSLIKHQFLSQYLESAAFKTLQAKSPVFNYIDAFAGPWNVSDQDYSDSSFERALKMLEGVRIALARIGKPGLRIRFCLCEKDKKAFARLSDYAKTRSKFEIHIFPGEFEENLQAIARVVPDGFTFTFIDPKGWDIRNQEVFQFLRERNGEFMLNFMSDHINRHTEYAPVMASVGRFLADPDWSTHFDMLPADWSNEERVLHLLKSNMRTNKVAKFFPDFSIQVPRKNRVKMRLILGTSSVVGVEVFRDIQAKVEVIEAEIRIRLQGENKDKGLFDESQIAQVELSQIGSGGKLNRSVAREKVLEILRAVGSGLFQNISTEVMVDVNIRKTHMKDLLIKIRHEGLVKFDLPYGKKKPQEDTRISIVD
jgi:three-Cys-motif partner protein